MLDAKHRHCVALIAAIAQNGIIGVDNRLPWRLAADLRRFRALTSGHSIIMGRKTWESLGKPLPDRQNIVVTRQREFLAPGAEIAASLAGALAAVSRPEPVFVIGGEALYREALPLADKLYLTEIHRDFEGDTRFPGYARGAWRETLRETHHADAPGGFDYAFTAYERIADAR
jgi:dihydrofolate reductase